MIVVINVIIDYHERSDITIITTITILWYNDTMNKRIVPLLPNLAICEWGQADTDSIIQDVIICREHNLSAISSISESLPVLGNLTDATRIYAFIDNPDRLAALASKPNISAQLFVHHDDISNIQRCDSVPTVIALKLSQIEHLSWNNIFISHQKTGAAGFLFIDDGGKYLNRFYNFLNLMPNRDFEVQYCAATIDIAANEAAYRLVKKLRPEILPKFRLFVTREFFKSEELGARS